jgi:hypothetical protein
MLELATKSYEKNHIVFKTDIDHISKKVAGRLVSVIESPLPKY